MALTKTGTDGIKDDAITLDKLAHGTSSQNGKFLRANNGAAPSFETVNTDLVADTSPQLGGTLDLNGNQINGGDSNGSSTNMIMLGASNDLQIYHDGSHSRIKESGTGNLILQTSKLNINNADNTKAFIHTSSSDGVELYHDNGKKLETTSYGALVTGTLSAGSGNFDVSDNGKFKAGNSSDLQIYHDGSNSFIKDAGTGTLRIEASEVGILSADGSETMAQFVQNGAASLRYDNSTRLETTSGGIDISGSTDGVLNLNTTDSRGSFIRFQQNGTSKVFVGCGQGLSLGDKDDLGLVATDNIIFKAGSAESARINNLGDLNIGQVANDCRLGIKQRSGNPHFIDCRDTSSTLKMYVHSSGNLYNTNGSYGQTSDQSLKENIVDAKSQWNDIKNIKIRNFNFTEASGLDTHTQIGCVAQEVEAVSPKLVTTPRDDGIKTVSTSILYMKAVKALQEAMERIETLETKALQESMERIETLETKVTALEAA